MALGTRASLATIVVSVATIVSAVEVPAWADDQAADSATFGAISLLRADDARGLAHPAAAMESAHEPTKPLATSIWAETIDDAASGAGLRLSSTGISGGTAGQAKTVSIATVGRGTNDVDLAAFDHDRGALGAGRFGESLKDVDGHLPSELVQRVVRNNFGRFQTCYQGGLRKTPTLRGRVVVKFVIDHRGAVALAKDAGSDLPDPEVTACVVRAFDTLAFPESKDSSVTVVYPLVFSP